MVEAAGLSSGSSSGVNRRLLTEGNPTRGLSSGSSVGRAGDCSKSYANIQSSPSHWFDSDPEDTLTFVKCLEEPRASIASSWVL